MSIVEIIRSLSWRPIPSKIGDLGTASLPLQMTLAEALSLTNQNITLDGKSYRIGTPQVYRGTFQITAFPANGNNGDRRTMQVG